MGPKSILKKSSQLAPEDENPALARATAREKRNMELALYHANLIQQQKDISNLILTNMEELLEHPLDSSTSSCPTSAATADFARLIAPFQPTDYDDLLEERYCAGRCGYVLCPNPPRGDQGLKSTGGFRILRDRMHGGAQIVPRESLKKWCSEDCARRAMYIRVQLNEQPAWERRAAGASVNIELLTDKESRSIAGLEAVTKDEDMRAAMENLALERGQSINAAGSDGVLKGVVQESRHVGFASATAPKPSGSHAEIEGYTPIHEDMDALNLDDDDDDDDLG